MKRNVDLTENNAFSSRSLLRISDTNFLELERNLLSNTNQKPSKLATWNKLFELKSFDNYWKARREIIDIDEDGTYIKLGERCYRCGKDISPRKIWYYNYNSELCPECDEMLETTYSNGGAGSWKKLIQDKIVAIARPPLYTDFQHRWFKNKEE